METWAYISPLLGLVLLFFSFAFIQTDATEERRRKRLVALPTTRIADATGRGVVELRGRVLVDPEQEPLIAPFTQRRVVWLTVSLEYLFGHGKSSSWQHLAALRRTRSFFLDDGSGQQARVELDTSEANGEPDVDIGATMVKEVDRDEERPPMARAFIEEAHVFANDKPLRFYEAVISEGDELTIVGPSRRERRASETGYRDESTQLVLSQGVGPAQALFVSRTTERERVAFKRAFIGAAVGLLIAAIIVFVTGGYCIYRVAKGP